MLCFIFPGPEMTSCFLGIFQQLLKHGFMYNKFKKTCWVIRLTWVFSNPCYLKNKSDFFLCVFLCIDHVRSWKPKAQTMGKSEKSPRTRVSQASLLLTSVTQELLEQPPHHVQSTESHCPCHAQRQLKTTCLQNE